MKQSKEKKPMDLSKIIDIELAASSEVVPENRVINSDFESMYKAYAEKVFRFAWFRVGKIKDVAEDIMQDTFTRAFAHYHTFQDRGFSYLTYLLSITQNLVISWYRQTSQKQEIGLDSALELPSSKPSPLQEYEKKETQQILIKVMKRCLNPTEQMAMWLKYVWDLPISAIAFRLKKTENAVKLILSRSRKKMLAQPEFRMKRDCLLLVGC
jgi:RNA polymerase sigma-70 factor, ECF subfamily